MEAGQAGQGLSIPEGRVPAAAIRAYLMADGRYLGCKGCVEFVSLLRIQILRRDEDVCTTAKEDRLRARLTQLRREFEGAGILAFRGFDLQSNQAGWDRRLALAFSWRRYVFEFCV